jgi:8-oxo-dGTP pyrophosphatase MutT (NUDIX family)
MASSENNILRQYGALPFLITREGEIRILLVTTRGQRGWILPKGWPIRHLTAAATAAREAYEEAGAIGTIVGDEPCASFVYEKRADAGARFICEVSVFLLAVERQLRKWPEKAQRKTRWFTPEAASRLVVPPGLGEILRGDVACLVNRAVMSGAAPTPGSGHTMASNAMTLGGPKR